MVLSGPSRERRSQGPYRTPPRRGAARDPSGIDLASASVLAIFLVLGAGLYSRGVWRGEMNVAARAGLAMVAAALAMLADELASARERRARASEASSAEQEDG